MASIAEFPSLERRDDVVCPNSNGTVYTADGYSWNILCNYDYPGFDLPAQPATSLSQCISACNNYKQDENQRDGASCVAIVYNSANINGRLSMALYSERTIV